MSKACLATIGICVTDDRRIFRTIRSLAEMENRRRFEVIVVANGNRNLFDSLLAEKRIDKLLWQERASMPLARNMVLSKASGDYVLFTDSDVEVEPMWASELLEELKKGEFAAVGGRIEKLTPKNWIQRESDTIVGGQNALNYLPAAPLPYVVGANCGFAKEAIVDVGGYSAEFVSGNDVDVCYKLGIAGHKVGLVPAAVVFHDDRMTMWAHFRRYYKYAVYQALLFKRYRHLQGEWLCWNPYPWQKYFEALSGLTQVLRRQSKGKRGEICQVSILKFVEATAVLLGDISGSVKHKVIYI